MIRNLIPYGKKNAVHLDVLSQITGMSTRAVKRCIKDARQEGVPILSSDCGYWMGTDEEKQQFVDLMYKQALSRFVTVKAIRQQLKGISK